MIINTNTNSMTMMANCSGCVHGKELQAAWSAGTAEVVAGFSLFDAGDNALSALHTFGQGRRFVIAVLKREGAAGRSRAALARRLSTDPRQRAIE